MSDTYSDPGSAPGYGGANVWLPQVTNAYQNDPRRLLVQALMSNGQAAVQRPSYNGLSALANGLSAALPALAGVKLSSDYAGLNKQALGDLQNAESASAGSPATTDASGNVTAPAVAPDSTKLAQLLMKSPVWAPQVLQGQLAAAAKMASPTDVAPQHQLVVNGKPVYTNDQSTALPLMLIDKLKNLPAGDPQIPALQSLLLGEMQKGGYLPQMGANGQPQMASIPGGPASPTQVGALKSAETNAQNQSDLAYKPVIAANTARDEAPYKTVEVRPGGAALPVSSVLGLTTPPAASPQPSRSNYVGASLLAKPPAPNDAVAAPNGATPPAGLPPQKQGQPDNTPPNLTPQMPAQTGASTPASSGVGMTRLPGGGVSIPNPSIVEPLIREDALEVTKDREAALAGQKDQATLQTIRDFLPKVQTGWGADTKLEAAQIMKAAGVSDSNINDFLSTDVAAGQILSKKFTENSAAAARTMGAREPGSVIGMFQKSYQNLGTDPQAVTMMTNAQWMDRQRQNKLAAEKTNFLNNSVNQYQATGNYRGLRGFNEQFAKTDPAESYLHAAEAMSGVPNGWKAVTDPAQQQSVIDLIPSGTTFMAPNGSMKVKP